MTHISGRSSVNINEQYERKRATNLIQIKKRAIMVNLKKNASALFSWLNTPQAALYLIAGFYIMPKIWGWLFPPNHGLALL
ncbi:MAG: hypothetical protein WC464_07355 [Bdellovibrionales bacterium]